MEIIQRLISAKQPKRLTPNNGMWYILNLKRANISKIFQVKSKIESSVYGVCSTHRKECTPKKEYAGVHVGMHEVKLWKEPWETNAYLWLWKWKSEKVGLKFNIHKTKIMALGPITSR